MTAVLDGSRSTHAGASAAPVGLSAADLASLVETFQDATSKLERTHASLRQEVSRLEGELVDTKAQLRRASELAALGEMAAGISHEVRNPLGSIRLYAQLIHDDLGDRPESKQTATKIIKAVDGLDAIVGDVLAFSREMRLRVQWCESGLLLEQAASACAAQACDGVELIVQDSGARSVLADASLVHQALVNVVRNGCEATRKSGGGLVRLGVGERRVLDADGRRVVMDALVISDEGDGIPAAAKSRIFNPFFTTRETGTGLGLAIVHRIMNAHGGRVHIDTSTGGERPAGTTVELLLPKEDAPNTGGPIARADQSCEEPSHEHRAGR